MATPQGMEGFAAPLHSWVEPMASPGSDREQFPDLSFASAWQATVARERVERHELEELLASRGQ